MQLMQNIRTNLFITTFVQDPMTLAPKYFLLALAVIGITACSKKNDTKPSSAIVGKWHLVADTTKNYTNGSLTETDVEPITDADYAQFNTDGSGVTANSSSITNFTYTISGNTLIIKTAAQNQNGVHIDALTENYAIKKLSSSQLFLFSDDTENDSGTTYRMTEASYFTK